MRFLVATLLALLAIACSRAPQSVYTGLSEAECPATEPDRQDMSAEDVEIYEAMGMARQECGGVGGYQLVIHSEDARITLDVIAPDGRVFPLDYYHAISASFTTHGDKAEWRMVRKGWNKVPVALIVRVNAYENPDDPQKFTSYLAVAKITPDQVCVTDKIAPGPDQNVLARRAADSAAGKPCLQLAVPAGSQLAATTSTQAAQCDIWGLNLLSPHYLGVGSVWPDQAGPYSSEVVQLWQRTFGVSDAAPAGLHHNYCLKSRDAFYGMSAVFRSETEGSLFRIREYASEASCKDQNFTDRLLPFPQVAFSTACPWLYLGATAEQIEQQLGPAHVKHGESSYYLQDNTAGNRTQCQNWLSADVDNCCFPGMALTFSGNRLKEIGVYNGGGEGPPCDEHPDRLE